MQIPMKEKLLKHGIQIGQLRDVLDVLRFDRQNSLVRRLVRKHQDGTVGIPDESEDDDYESINFGEQKITNVHNKSDGMGTALKIVATLALGVVLGAGSLYILNDLLFSTDPVEAVGLDHDTQYDLQFID